MTANLESRLFPDVMPKHAGDVSDRTVFEYGEDDDATIWRGTQRGTHGWGSPSAHDRPTPWISATCT
jgi:hypothetical protein